MTQAKKSMAELDLEVTTLHLDVAQMKAKISQIEYNIEFVQKEIPKFTGWWQAIKP